MDALALCKNAMDKYSVEIAGGLGPTAGKVWRVGIMVRTPHCPAVRLQCMPRVENSAGFWAGMCPVFCLSNEHAF